MTLTRQPSAEGGPSPPQALVGLEVAGGLPDHSVFRWEPLNAAFAAWLCYRDTDGTPLWLVTQGPAVPPDLAAVLELRPSDPRRCGGAW